MALQLESRESPRELGDDRRERRAFARPRDAHELPADEVGHRNAIGLPAGKRHNLVSLSADTILCAAGNFVLSINLRTGTQSHIAGSDGRGIGCVALHPSDPLFAFGEAGSSPNCYIMQYPTSGSLKDSTVKRVLRNGTSRAFTAARFSPEGSRLATVGASPDFLLTIWDWASEKIILRNKAFSQEVLDVSFSRRFEGRLITCGIGHICFWTMAQTFTGLKLQGQIGKLGNEEVSDVLSHAELPSGNILSGSESGRMHLWEGNLIKVPFVLPNGSNVHEGSIDVMQALDDQECVLTAGADGMLNYWDLHQLSEADLAEDAEEYAISPLASYFLGSGMSVRNLVHMDGSFVVQNANGSFDRVSLPHHQTSQLLTFHSGAINAAVPCAKHLSFVTCGSDGTIRGYECKNGKQTCMRSFGARAHTMVSVPERDGLDVAVGFSDGVVRVLRPFRDGMKLLGTAKPSSSPVLFLAYSPDCKLMASVSSDNTAFFFDCTRWGERIENGSEPSLYSPVGYVELQLPSSKASVQCCTWTYSSSALLIGLSEGGVLYVPPPQRPSSRFTTFKSDDVSQTRYPFHRLCKVDVTSDDNDDGLTDQDSEQHHDENLRDFEKEHDSVDGSDEAGYLASKDARADTFSQNKPAAQSSRRQRTVQETTFSVLCIERDPIAKDVLWLAAGRPASGLVCKVTLDPSDCTPLEEVELHASDVTLLQFVGSGTLILSGSAEGEVRCEPRSGSLKGYPWKGNLHGDFPDGRVSALAFSYDSSCLISASSDGCLFTLNVSERIQSIAGAEGHYEETLIPIVHPSSLEANDLAHKALSIEQAKQKAEHDHLQWKAEERKRTVREQIEEFRQEFTNILRENENLPSSVRVPRDQLRVDGGLEELAEEQNRLKVEQVQDEMQEENECSRKRLEKMRHRFLDPVKHECFRLHSFKGGRGHFVCSAFRVAELSDSMRRDIEEARRERADRSIRGSEGNNTRRTRCTESDRQQAFSSGVANHPDLAAAAAQHVEHAQQKNEQQQQPIEAYEDNEENMTKQEARRLRRRRREREWEAFMAKKPGDDYEDPEDAQAIDDAKNDMGDFKLKSDPNYIVPQEERINTENKRQQLLLLEDEMQAMKLEFNEQLAMLREVKCNIVEEVNAGNERIRAINEELGMQEGIWELSIEEEEFPTESRERISDTHLIEFEDELRAKGLLSNQTERIIDDERRKRVHESASSSSSSHASAEKHSQRANGQSKRQQLRRRLAAQNGVTGQPEDQLRLLNAQAQFSETLNASFHPPTEGCDERDREAHLRYERDQLISRQETLVSSFDQALQERRQEKLTKEADLKAAELKKIVFVHELQLLKDFEKRDNSLQNKYDSKLTELQDLEKWLQDSQSKLDVRSQEVERCLEAKRQIQKEFDQLVDKSHPFRQLLLRAFNRKIKRKNDGEKHDEEDSNEEESDEVSDDDEEEEIAPSGCDQLLFEKICDLCERKQKQEDEIAEVHKSIDSLKREVHIAQKKQQNVQTQLNGVKCEVEEFQKEKQGKLNSINISVPLRAEQVKHLVDMEVLPTYADLSKGLIFHNESLCKLESRIDEVEEEKKRLNQENLQLKKQHSQLEKDRREKETRIANLEQKAHEVQLSKFGQEIDLEKVDRMGTSEEVEKLEWRLRKQKEEQDDELKRWDDAIEEAQQELDRLTRENTRKVETIIDHSSEQQKLDRQASQKKKHLFHDPVAARQKEVEERDRLRNTVNKQAEELKSLREDIKLMAEAS